MPRLSLYRPDRTNDYRFLDRRISEMYTVGGLDIFVHKYAGVAKGGEDSALSGNGDATQPVYDSENPLFIEDLLLLENRDRVYDPNIYVMRGVYQVQDIDFDLTQFGLFLNGDTLFITFHYNDMIDTLGRKLMAGDVLEVPNLKDYHPLNPAIPLPLPRYYVIQDAKFAAEGFSQTWLPHTWRVKATPMVNAQEYNSILNKPVQDATIWDNGNFYPAGSWVLYGSTYYYSIRDVPPGANIDDQFYWQQRTPETIGDQVSTRLKDYEINDAILTQADVEVPLSGYDTTKFYIVPTKNGVPVTPQGINISNGDVNASSTIALDDSDDGTPVSDGYTMGYLTGDGIAPNGLPVTPGVTFPLRPREGDYALRLDFFPNRLFRYNGTRWIKIEDNVRTDLNNGPANKTLRSSFVNNTETVNTTDRGEIPSRQSLSEILKPRADNGG
jgi:hypothetical protein